MIAGTRPSGLAAPKASGIQLRSESAASCNPDKSRLRLLDACLKELEDANERSETVVSAQLARKLQNHLPAVSAGMPIVDALELVFSEQSRPQTRLHLHQDAKERNSNHDSHPSVNRPSVTVRPSSLPTMADHSEEHTEARKLTEGEARTLTQLIRERSSDLSILLLTAHRGRAWLALGYRSWEQYVRTEFSLSRSRSYELIDHGRVLQALRAVTDMSVIADITPYDARRVKSRLSGLVDSIRVGVAANSSPELTRTIVATAIDHARRQYDEDRRPAGKGRTTSRQNQDLPNTQLEIERPGFEALGVEFKGPELETLRSIHRLYDALDYIAFLPDPAIVVNWVDKHQPDRIENLSCAAAWLSAFDKAWKQHADENGRRRVPKHATSA